LPDATRNRTALIVDDDSTLRYVLARIARHVGYETVEANDATTAMEILKTKSPQVVVADLRLPDFDGFELCRRIKAQQSTKAIPVIMVTSMYYESGKNPKDIAEGKKRAKSVGAVDLLPRGDALEQLGPLLKTVSLKGSSKKKKA